MSRRTCRQNPPLPADILAACLTTTVDSSTELLNLSLKRSVRPSHGNHRENRSTKHGRKVSCHANVFKLYSGSGRGEQDGGGRGRLLVLLVLMVVLIWVRVGLLRDRR